jgi:hypothetical protein
MRAHPRAAAAQVSVEGGFREAAFWCADDRYALVRAHQRTIRGVYRMPHMTT